jgi:hypothetical protein
MKTNLFKEEMNLFKVKMMNFFILLNLLSFNELKMLKVGNLFEYKLI